MLEVIERIEEWAEARNLIAGSTPLKQANKTSEEVNELVAALGKLQVLKTIPNNEMDTGVWAVHFSAAFEEAKDAIGDVVVTLVVIASQLGLPLEACVKSAYEEIKDRKGRMENGLFVKEASELSS